MHETYSHLRLVLNSDLMGEHWLALRRCARRFFPGVNLQERAGSGSASVVIDVRHVHEEEGGQSVFAAREPAETGRFEALLRAELDRAVRESRDQGQLRLISSAYSQPVMGGSLLVPHS